MEHGPNAEERTPTSESHTEECRPAKSHDPLCDCDDPEHDEYECCECVCDVIAKVRDVALDDFLNRVMPETFNGQWELGYEQGRLHEREQAALRVAQNVLVGMTLTAKEVRAVIAAVRGES